MDKVVKRFQSHLKLVFSNALGQDKRVVATNGFVVMELKLRPLHQDPGAEVRLGDIDGMFFHIALQYWKPTESTLLRMVVCDTCDPLAGELVLRVASSAGTTEDTWDGYPFCDLHRLISEFDLRCEIHVVLWTLVDAPIALARPFVPGMVEVRRLQESESCLWRGTPQEARGRRPHRHVVLDASDDDAPAPIDDVAPPPRDGGHDNGSDGGSEDPLNSSSNSSDDGREHGEGSIDFDEGIQHLLYEIGTEEDAADRDEEEDDAEGAHSADFEEDGSNSEHTSSSFNSDDYRSVSATDSESCDVEGASPSSEPGAPEWQRSPSPLPSAGSEPRSPRASRQAEGVSVFRGEERIGHTCIKFNSVNDEFYAKCVNEAHGPKCFITRVAHAGRKRAQGRPLGLLAAWVLDSYNEAYATQQQHNRCCRPSREARRAARQNLGRDPAEAQVLADFLSKERAPRDGEGSEPEDCP